MKRISRWIFAEDDQTEPDMEPQELDHSDGEPRRRRGSVLPWHSSRAEGIFIRWPKDREDARVCADCLRARRPVVVNLSQLDHAQAMRVFDFLTGAAYALGGQIEQVGEGVFLVSPKDMEIIGDSPYAQEEASWQEA